MKRIVILLICILTSHTLYAQNKYGTYSVDGTKYNVSEEFLEAIYRYNPAAAKALRRGRNVQLYSHSGGEYTIYGLEAEDWAWLLTPKEFEKLSKPGNPFQSQNLSKARDYIRQLAEYFSPQLYQKSPSTLDLTQKRYLRYGIVDGKKKIITLRRK